MRWRLVRKRPEILVLPYRGPLARFVGPLIDRIDSKIPWVWVRRPPSGAGRGR